MPSARRSTSGGPRAAARSSSRVGPGHVGVRRQLEITRGPVDQPLSAARRFADGLSSWLVRRTDGTNEWMVFDRPAGSERDLVVLASVLDATIIQRHPAGSVRVVGGSASCAGRGSAGTTSRRSARGSTPSPRVRSTATPRCSRRCWSSPSTTSDRGGSARCSSTDPMASPARRSRNAFRRRRPCGSAAPRTSPRSVTRSRRSTAPPSSTPTGAAPARRAAGAEQRGRRERRGVRRHAPHVGPPLQLRRSARHRDRGERGRSRLRAPQRRGARPLPQRLKHQPAARTTGVNKRRVV